MFIFFFGGGGGGIFYVHFRHRIILFKKYIYNISQVMDYGILLYLLLLPYSFFFFFFKKKFLSYIINLIYRLKIKTRVFNFKA
jgi:hypothetical protein